MHIASTDGTTHHPDDQSTVIIQPLGWLRKPKL